MCGIIGLYGKKDVVEKTLDGLIAIQHRGQDSCGVYSLHGNKVDKKKCSGLVSENRSRRVGNKTLNEFEDLRGNMALGHVRYATIGDSSVENAQPFYSDLGVSLCHNGNVTNVPRLKEELMNAVPRRHVNSDCDADIILKVFVDELARYQLKRIEPRGIFEAVGRVMERVQGSYSALSMINDVGFVAFRDPKGIKPIVFGKKETEDETIYGFASESVAFDALRFKLIDNLKPGEAIFIDKMQRVHRQHISQYQEHRPCVFEPIYFAFPTSVIDGKSVYEARMAFGRLLGKDWKKISAENKFEVDFVSETPTSAFATAMGFAEETGIPYRPAFFRNPYLNRSFIQPNQKMRENTADLKLMTNNTLLKGKSLVLIEDSIVRGTTSKNSIKKLREAGAKKIYFGSSAPPIKYPCVYGVDMSIMEDLIASKKSIEEIKEAIGADYLFYQSIENLKKALPEFNCCDACFSGEYPTNISLEQLLAIENERLSAKKEAITA